MTPAWSSKRVELFELRTLKARNCKHSNRVLAGFALRTLEVHTDKTDSSCLKCISGEMALVLSDTDIKSLREGFLSGEKAKAIPYKGSYAINGYVGDIGQALGYGRTVITSMG